jgi:agmatine/peptidylarginine deiminase
VEGQGAENSARNTFQSAGIDLDNVVFIQADVYSMWSRDWGPQCVFDADGVMGVADPWFAGYPWVPGCNDTAAGTQSAASSRSAAPSLSAVSNSSTVPSSLAAPIRSAAERQGRGYEDDDVLPWVVAQALGLPHHPLAAYCTGGNIMTDGQGIAYSTEQMLAENAPYMDAATFFARAEEVMGVTDYRLVLNPEILGIQHIDCYAKLLDEETVLVKEVPGWHPEYQCCEDLAATFAGMTTCYDRSYRVRRIWCAPYQGNDVAAYTNSLILNRKVLVPVFGISADEVALDTYREAMPGYEVIGFDHSSWYYYDALHCRTMGIFDGGMIRMLHARLGPVVPAGVPHVIDAWIDDRSEAGLVDGAQTVRWRLQGQPVWQTALLAAVAADSFRAQLPVQAPGAIVEYYLTAADHSGRSETLPRSAPAGWFSFEVDPTATAVPAAIQHSALRTWPNPANPRVTFAWTAADPVELVIHDLRGRHVRTITLAVSQRRISWDGKDQRGIAAPTGRYLAQLRTASGTIRAAVTLVR